MRSPGHGLGEPPPATLILAAGKGTRLGELGLTTPKVLLPMQGRPLLDLHLDHLAAQGVRRAVINAHHLAEQIVEHVERYRGPLELTVLVEEQLLGTAGAAINALGAFGARRLVVLYGDVLIFEPLAPLLDSHRASGAAATLAVYEREDTQEKGVVTVDENGTILSFAEKDPERAGPGLVNAGLYVIEPELLKPFPPASFLDFGHDVFPEALGHGARLHAHRIPAPVIDVGTPSDLERARAGERPAPGAA